MFYYMLSKKLIISTAIALPIFGGVLMANASTVYAGNPECKAEVDLQGSVSQNKAKVTNYSKHCTYDATLAVYDSPQAENTPGWIEAQTLRGSKTVSVKPGETVEFEAELKEGSSCLNQADLVRESKAWDKPHYVNAMDVELYRDDSCNVVTATPTPGPTATPTPGATATPTPKPGVTSFAPTGNTLMTYVLVLAGVASLITGIVLRRFSK